MRAPFSGVRLVFPEGESIAGSLKSLIDLTVDMDVRGGNDRIGIPVWEHPDPNEDFLRGIPDLMSREWAK